MTIYSQSVTIGGLFNIATADPNVIIPVFLNGTTYKITAANLLAMVTKGSVGLGNVDNTSDLNKPLSNAIVDALVLKANVGHGHEIADVNGLAASLLSKASVGHNHSVSDVVGLQQTLDGKADDNHTQPISSIVDLEASLASKANAADVQAALSAKSDVGHVHQMAEVVGLISTLQDYALQGNVNAAIAQLSETLTESINVLSNNVAVNDAQIRNQAQSDVTMLTNLLGTKAPLTHRHDAADIDNLDLSTKPHVHAVSDVTGLNGRLDALALQTSVDTSIANLRTEITSVTDGLQTSKAPVNHSHNYANAEHNHSISDITNLDDDLNSLADSIETKAPLAHVHQISDIPNLQESLDMKVGFDHTHSVSDINNFPNSVKSVVRDMIIAGDNVTVVEDQGNLVINSSGGGGAEPQGLSSVIFNVTSDRYVSLYTNEDSESLLSKTVNGNDFATHEAYSGNNFIINEAGTYRLKVQTNCQISDKILINGTFSPETVPVQPVPFRQGHKLDYYSGAGTIGANETDDHKLLDLSGLPIKMGAWDSVFYFKVEQNSIPATVSLKTVFEYDVDYATSNDISNFNHNEWKVNFNSTVFIEQLETVAPAATKPPGLYAIRSLRAYDQYADSNATVSQWEPNSYTASEPAAFTYDMYDQSTTLAHRGVYKITVTVKAERRGDIILEPQDNPFVEVNTGTVLNNISAIQIHGLNSYTEVGMINLKSQSYVFGSWVHEYYITAVDNGSKFSMAAFFRCQEMYDKSQNLDFLLQMHMEKIGEYYPI